MEQLIKQTLDTIARLSNSKQIALFNVVDNQNFGILGVLNQGEFISHNREEHINIKNTPFEKILSTQETHTFPGGQVNKLSLPFPTYKETNSTFKCLCLPLLGGENHPVAGIIVVAQKTEISLPPERLQFLKMLTPLIAAILEATEENKRAIQLTIKDFLTNLYTRSYFEMRLQEETKRVKRYGGEFSILRLDINQLRTINNNYGYKEGNRVLQVFS